jgi:hypothetical protein
LYRCEATQTPFRRAFTTSRCFKQEASTEAKDEDAARAEELSAKARKRDMKKVTTGSSAQALENDRPWHRAESQEPGAKDPDIPDTADMKKGKLCINDIQQTSINTTRTSLDNPNTPAEAHPPDALSS